MIKKIYLFAAILSVSLLCGCERQRMTAELYEIDRGVIKEKEIYNA